jgi:hypothetical protein
MCGIHKNFTMHSEIAAHVGSIPENPDQSQDHCLGFALAGVSTTLA